MSIGSAFKQGASTIISTFASEFKKCTYRSLNADSAYNPETGEYSGSYTEYDIPIAFIGINDEAPYPSDYRASHEKAYISGNDLPVRPKRGDKIIKWDGSSLLVDEEVKTDMYGALYTVYVMMENKG